VDSGSSVVDALGALILMNGRISVQQFCYPCGCSVKSGSPLPVLLVNIDAGPSARKMTMSTGLKPVTHSLEGRKRIYASSLVIPQYVFENRLDVIAAKLV
jgi:hypothetical protein